MKISIAPAEEVGGSGKVSINVAECDISASKLGSLMKMVGVCEVVVAKATTEASALGELIVKVNQGDIGVFLFRLLSYFKQTGKEEVSFSMGYNLACAIFSQIAEQDSWPLPPRPPRDG